MMASTGRTESRQVALLGPTNTGKTHRAVERMLEHQSGMFGLPLRLLAREVYDRVCDRVGPHLVALVTGEERRTPPRPCYWICTVEAMPMEVEVDFLAVDEIQLAGDSQRGHVFTDRLLRGRGRLETWFLGAETIRARIEELAPTTTIQSHPRLSTLRGDGSVGLGQLPPRTAVVAFSAARVYAIAERLRRRRGGAAVVLGALSPRARNAQVDLYRSGEVDFLVATDAIGMGLNLNVDRVAFAELGKFDGDGARALTAAELGQIAGRAGRYLNDGDFCTLAPLPSLDPSLIRDIELHRFPQLDRLVWRNGELDFATVDRLIDSLHQDPHRGCLRRVRHADDFHALVQLAGDRQVADRATHRSRVQLLWEVCRIPDFRQLMLEDHVDLLRQVFLQVSGPLARIDTDWMARRIASISKELNDVDTILTRMAFIRTWTYITQRADWVADAGHWQEVAREVEDRLSDVLHERLVDRFVDPGRARRIPRAMTGSAGAPGGHRDRAPDPPDRLTDRPFAALATIHFDGDPSRGLTPGRLQAILTAADDDLHADAKGILHHRERPLARLRRGPDLLRPEVLLLDGVAAGAARSALHRRLLEWTRAQVADLLGPLRELPSADDDPAARGLRYLLEQGLGSTAAAAARELLPTLSTPARNDLRRRGVRLGHHTIYLRSALEPTMVRRRWTLANAHFRTHGAALELPRSTAHLAYDDTVQLEAYQAIGYPVVGPIGIRADHLEQLQAQVWREGRSGRAFRPSPLLQRQVGRTDEELARVLSALGCRPIDDGRFRTRSRNRRRRRSA